MFPTRTNPGPNCFGLAPRHSTTHRSAHSYGNAPLDADLNPARAHIHSHVGTTANQHTDPPDQHTGANCHAQSNTHLKTQPNSHTHSRTHAHSAPNQHSAPTKPNRESGTWGLA